jgi:hypothetical protein
MTVSRGTTRTTTLRGCTVVPDPIVGSRGKPLFASRPIRARGAGKRAPGAIASLFHRAALRSLSLASTLFGAKSSASAPSASQAASTVSLRGER